MDRRVRQLERRWLETQDEVDYKRYLVARARSLGDEVALLALEDHWAPFTLYRIVEPQLWIPPGGVRCLLKDVYGNLEELALQVAQASWTTQGRANPRFVQFVEAATLLSQQEIIRLLGTERDRDRALLAILEGKLVLGQKVVQEIRQWKRSVSWWKFKPLRLHEG